MSQSTAVFSRSNVTYRAISHILVFDLATQKNVFVIIITEVAFLMTKWLITVINYNIRKICRKL